MIFFTDITTNASNYCLLNIKKYNDFRKFKKKQIFVDPGVYELRTAVEYKHITLLHELAAGGLTENEYISIDYPCDMIDVPIKDIDTGLEKWMKNPSKNKTSNIKNYNNVEYIKQCDVFIQKSIANNLKYKENSQYICTIQFKFRDFDDFKIQWEYLSSKIEFEKKIIGIGNMCRIMQPNTFTDKVMTYILNHTSQGQWIHFYGLAKKLIDKYVPLLEQKGLIISVDSTKWTRAVTKELKLANGVCCKKHNRDLFFTEYMKAIKCKCF